MLTTIGLLIMFALGVVIGNDNSRTKVVLWIREHTKKKPK